MVNRPLESDWKIFRKRVPEWRERYLVQKNEEIIGILIDQNKTPTRRFWDAKEKMEEEARILRYCLDGHSRSKMEWYLHLMLLHGMIQGSDLDEFSKALSQNLLTLSRGFAE